MSLALASRAEVSSQAKPKAGDYLAGASGGGVLIYCAQHFISDPTLSQMAVYMCPAVSVFFVGLYQKTSKFIISWFDDFLGDHQRRRLLKKTSEDLKECQKVLSDIENNPLSTDGHRAKARKDVEELQSVYLQLRIKGSVKLVTR